MSFQQLALLFDREPSEADIVSWSEEDKDALREAVLLDALDSLLDKRNSLKTRTELWDWILTDSGPFSFDACARAVGVDPHALRVTFSRLVEREAILGNIEDGFLEKTAQLLGAYLEEPAARSRVHARH